MDSCVARFGGIACPHGAAGLEKLRRAYFCVVGSWTAEAYRLEKCSTCR